MTLVFEPAFKLVALMRKREISPVALLETYLERIDRLNPRLHAFLTVAHDQAREAARKAEKAIRENSRLGPLTGLPVAVKDTESTRGIRTTQGSLVYENMIPDEDAILVERLRAAGAILIGKSNTPEFAMAGDTRNRLGPDCANPWDVTRTSGGSSGGSACAIAAGLSPLATGSDCGGSITIPAAFCGTFGFKPSHGLIPCYPSLKDWPLLLTSGPITRTVKDAELFLSVVCGPDDRDPLSLCPEVPASIPSIKSELTPLRIGWATRLWGQPVEPEIQAALKKAAGVFDALGCRVEEIVVETPVPYESWFTLDLVDQFVARGHLLAHHADKLCEEVRAALEQGAQVSAKAYAEAHNDRHRFRGAVAKLYKSHDLLLVPSTACTAFPHEKPPRIIDGQPVGKAWNSYAPFNMWANMIRGPSASLPIGFSAQGLPIGGMLLGAQGQDTCVLTAAAAFEEACPWAHLRPDMD